MDSSFLTFSPKISTRKNLFSNGRGTSKSRFQKLKFHPLQNARSSQSNQCNIEKNGKGSNGSKNKTSDTIVLDDSIVLLCENVKKIGCTSPPSTPSATPCATKLPRTEPRTSEKYGSLSSKCVRDKDLKTSEHDKFDEIRNWLNELHNAHERKKQIPVWSIDSASSSVIECSFNSNESILKTNVIPETSSDESVKQNVGKKSPQQVCNDFKQKIQVGRLNRNKSKSGSDEQLARGVNPSASSSVTECFSYSKNSSSKSERSDKIIPETSSDASEKRDLKEKRQSVADNNINERFEGRGNLCWRKSGSSSDDSWQPLRRKRTVFVSSSSELDGENSSRSHLDASENSSARFSSSDKSCESASKQKLPHNKRVAGITSKRSTNSSSSNKSIASSGSAGRIISEMYGEAWNKNTVLTPSVQKKRVVIKETYPEDDTASIEELLFRFYGDALDKQAVLTPCLDRRKDIAKKGKENTPPVSKKEVDVKGTTGKKTPKRKLPVSSTSTPKCMTTSRGELRNGKSLEILSFLRSLSASPSPLRSNPKALLYKKEFKKYKEVLCSELFQLYNTEIFDNKLPSTLKIEWNMRLYKTAGYCYQKWILRPEGRIRVARIELSTKVCSTADRVRDTLIHELCHAAAWLEDGYKGGHGGPWKAWARKATRRFPELPQINRCHAYKIDTKYIYKCKNCGYSIGRHSKSLDLSRKRCGLCFGEFELLVNAKTKAAEAGLTSTPRTPRAAAGFALFVKENYKATKQKNSTLKHAEVMKLLGTQYSGMKVGSGQQV